MRSHRTAATVAALAAATVLLDGCGSSVSGNASPTPSRSVTMKAATETSAADAPGAGPVGELQDVSGQGNLLKGLDDQQYAPRPQPGVKVSSAIGGCTLGPAVKRGVQTGFLIAEHCNGKYGEAGMQYARVNPQAKTPMPLAPITATDKPSDSAVVWTSEATDDTKIAGVWPVRGALTLPQVRTLNVSSRVCINGAVSGVRCGTVASSSDETMFLILPTHEGDSGSAVFVVDSLGDAWIAGVLVRGELGNNSDATPIAPILERLNAMVITA